MEMDASEDKEESGLEEEMDAPEEKEFGRRNGCTSG